MQLLPMKQTATIISTYSADVFGVCSALFELGGMVIMHDPSGCNSTYTTHDEPRWYDMDSMLYISGLTEMDAIMGDDSRLVHDAVEAAREQQPKFIVLAGTPIPMMTGTDFPALASLVEQETGIPSIGLATNSMHSYVRGVSLALEAIALRFLPLAPAAAKPQSPKVRVNVLGVTPLDFSCNGSDVSIRQWLKDSGFSVTSLWAMGSPLEELQQAMNADVNLVVSYGGLAAARVLQERFQIPYVIGTPTGGLKPVLEDALRRAASTGCCSNPLLELRSQNTGKPAITILGESIYSGSVAAAIAARTHRAVQLICPLETETALLAPGDCEAEDETDLQPYLQAAGCIIADPMYQPICPKNIPFIPLPHEGFSGRLYRSQIPNLIQDFDGFCRQLLQS